MKETKDSSQRLNKAEKSWILYDVANSAFIMIVTATIPIYFRSLAEGSGMSGTSATSLWGSATSISILILALLSPVLGAIADYENMKKKIVSALMVAAMVVTAFAGCGSDKGGTSTQGGDKTSKSSGKVYMLNFKPETDEAWQDLAETYTDQTGVEVNVLTAADGQYNTTLQSEMAKSDAPTIFNVGNSSAAQTWNDYTYDLKDSELYKHLTDKSLVINSDDKVAAIANCYECYGLIYNKTILEGYCGMDGAVVSSVAVSYTHLTLPTNSLV